MSMALQGIRVVELAAFEAGPVQATILGDYGAEVIKIERPGIGSPLRDRSTLYGRITVPADSDMHPVWENFHRNKKSLCINLKSEEGQQIAHRLIESADVFLSNVELVELDKFKMDYKTLSKINPRLIYAHSSGYGHDGPDATKRGFDMGAWARSGIMLKIAEPGMPPPLNPLGLPDAANATYSALGIILALYVRERTGRGQMVTNSLFGTLLWSCIISIGCSAVTGENEASHARDKEPAIFYNRYLTKDGRWLILLRSNWHAVCEAFGIQEYENDPRFDSYTKRVDNSAELIATFDKIIATKTAEEWAEVFKGKDVIWSVAQTFLEATKDPQTESNKYIVNFQHPKYGPTKLVGFPVRLSETPPTIRTAAPGIGQHNDEVLHSLGYQTKEIVKFKEEGVVWSK